MPSVQKPGSINARKEEEADIIFNHKITRTYVLVLRTPKKDCESSGDLGTQRVQSLPKLVDCPTTPNLNTWRHAVLCL